MPITTLNQATLSQLTCPEGKSHIEYCSDDVPGLLLDVYPSGKATWKLRYKIDEATKYFSFGPLSEVTLAQARKMALEMKAQIRAQGRDPRAEIKAKKEMITLEDFWTKHYRPYAEPRKRSFSRDEQLWRIRIQGKFGKMRLSQISCNQIQTFHTELLAEGLSPASCDLHIKLLKYMYNLSISWGLYDGSNPIKVPLFNVDNQVQNILTEDDLERLMTVLRTDSNRPVCLIVQWLLSTGMRLGATLAARWDQLDREHRILTIPASIAKSKRVSSIPLNDSAMAILDQLETEGVYKHFFVNKQRSEALGKECPYTTITKTWDRLRKQAGLPHFRLHDGRHTFASILINNNISIYTVSKLLSHSDVKVTSRYSHLSAKTLQDASNSASLTINYAMQKGVQSQLLEAQTIDSTATLVPPEPAKALSATV